MEALGNGLTLMISWAFQKYTSRLHQSSDQLRYLFPKSDKKKKKKKKNNK